MEARSAEGVPVGAAVAALPVEHPREFATALGRITREIWGPPGLPQQRGRAWLPSFACPMTRNALEMLLRGDVAASAALLVVPHTCDSMQALASQVMDLGAGGIPAVTFYHPRTLDAGARASFLRDELRRFRTEMERLLGPVADDRLAKAVAIHREADVLAARLLREGPRAGLPQTAQYAVLRARERLAVEEWLALMRDALDRRVEPRPRGAPIVLSGIVPEPPGLLDAIAASGMRVGFDDTACVGRRIPRDRLPEPTGDPMEDIARRYEALPPCPTRTVDPATRLDWVVAGARAAGVRGALFVVPARCEPELFDLAAVRGALRTAGVPSVVVETDFEAALPASIATRIEALGEMIGARSP